MRWDRMAGRGRNGMEWDGMSWEGMGWAGRGWAGRGWNRMVWDKMGWDGCTDVGIGGIGGTCPLPKILQ